MLLRDEFDEINKTFEETKEPNVSSLIKFKEHLHLKCPLRDFYQRVSSRANRVDQAHEPWAQSV